MVLHYYSQVDIILYYHCHAVPSTPTNNGPGTRTANSVQFSWTVPIRPNGLFSYNVYFVHGSTESTEMLLTTSQTSRTITGLNAYEQVCVMISARNSAGESPRSTERCATTLESGLTHLTANSVIFMFLFSSRLSGAADIWSDQYYHYRCVMEHTRATQWNHTRLRNNPLQSS